MLVTIIIVSNSADKGVIAGHVSSAALTLTHNIEILSADDNEDRVRGLTCNRLLVHESCRDTAFAAKIMDPLRCVRCVKVDFFNNFEEMTILLK
jgi:hypothetical protein